MASFWLERKYIDLLSPRLERFKWKSGVLANSRCPLCGDSQTNKKKARLYFYQKEGSWLATCHNGCGTWSFPKFLKKVDWRLFQEFQAEGLIEDGKLSHEIPEDVKESLDMKSAWESFLKLKKISQLPYDHPAKEYIVSRKIPNIWHSVFRWTPNFVKWINSDVYPGKFDKDVYDKGRIVIPFFTEGGLFHAVQGRTIDPNNEQRYISIELDDSHQMIWGLDKLDETKYIYALEGVFDALFIKNSLAHCGANYGVLTKVVDRDKLVMVWDFEPHSLDTKKKITASIDQGLKVVIPPDTVTGKDINRLILDGYSEDHCQWLIENHIYDGLRAKARLAEWTKR